jgi:O-antigen ligase
MALIYLASWAQGQPLNARQMHVGFDNPRFLNHAQTLFVPWLVLVFPLRESHRAWRRLAWCAATVHIAIAYLDVARGTWLAWGLTGLILLLHGARGQGRRLAITLGVGLLLGVLVADILPAWGAYQWELPFASKAAAGGAHSRDQLLAISVDMIVSAPWLGHGGMSFAANAVARATHPHNIYLQWAAEYGLPALLLILSLLLSVLIRASRQIRRLPTDSRDRTAALLAICIAALMDAMVSGNFVMPLAQIWIALAFGQLLAATCLNPSDTSHPAPRWKLTPLAALCVSQLLLLWVTVDQATREEPRLHGSTPNLQAGEKPRPRYWLNGQL